MRTAYLMETDEALQCISDVLVGLQMGVLTGADPQKLYRLEQAIHSAMLTGDARARDCKRAELLREAAASLQIV